MSRASFTVYMRRSGPVKDGQGVRLRAASVWQDAGLPAAEPVTTCWNRANRA